MRGGLPWASALLSVAVIVAAAWLADAARGGSQRAVGQLTDGQARGGDLSAATGVGRQFKDGKPGGPRVALADLVWIAMSSRWEQSEAAATLRAVRLATVLNPRSLHFWANGARIIAFDIAAWRIREAEARGHVPGAEKRRIRVSQGLEALRFLDEAYAQFPESSLPWIEKAQIELHAMGDRQAAARSFAVAAVCDDAPDFCARLAAELRRIEGRASESRALLESRPGSIIVSSQP